MEAHGLFIDLDHVPIQWIRGPIPPELDQKLYEMQILYDRDWSLNNAKLLMTKFYGSPERVDIRTEAHVVDSDIYLSRATSAFSRKDFRSAYLFATTALESILKVLIEVAQEPFSNSRFVEKINVSATKLGLPELFNQYLEIAKLKVVDNVNAKEEVRLFKLVWEEMKVVSTQNHPLLESAHSIVKTKLNYYLTPAFLQGMTMRVNSIIDSGRTVEAVHYMKSIFLDILENYALLKSSINKIRIDYSILMRSLESLENKNQKNYDFMMKILNLSDEVEPERAKNSIRKVKDIILKLRRERKVLIKNGLLKN